MPIKFTDLDPKMQRVLGVYPVHNPVKWVHEKGRIVLTYKKDFTKFEKKLHNKLGGPEDIRRPLDDKGSKIWELCDGQHTISDICDEMDDIYHEDIEPVLDRVWKFLEILLKLNLIRLEMEPVKPKKRRVLKNKNVIFTPDTPE
jgi:hypothetical protein